MKNKQCTRCKKDKNTKTEFYNDSDSSCSWCIACIREVEWSRQYNSSDRNKVNKYFRDYKQKNRDKVLEQQRAYRKNDPVKYKAHAAINNALRYGKVIKPNNCENCKKETKLEAHHYAGYEKENWFNVQWLCKECHIKADLFK